jgi:isocitrate dehydrogenase (NAD+)
MYRQGARHVARDIAGNNQANPLGTLFAAIMMLRHMDLGVYADKIERAVRTTVEYDRIFTPDVGGTATTRQVTHAIIKNLP